jgi:hypothetical protein
MYIILAVRTLKDNDRSPSGPEMKFVDTSLTKESSLLLHAIHGPFYWRILKKQYSNLVLKIDINNPRKTRKRKSFHELHFVEGRIEGRKFESEKMRVYAQKPRLNMPLKNSISGSVANLTRQEMEFLKDTLSFQFLVFYNNFSVLKMLLMNRLEFSCFADFLQGCLKPEKSMIFFKIFL